MMPMDGAMLVSAAVLILAPLALVAAAVWWQRRWMASTDGSSEIDSTLPDASGRSSATIPDDRP